MALLMQKGVKRRLARQSFQDLFEYKQAPINPNGERVFDISLNDVSAPPCAISRSADYRDEGFSYKAREKSRLPQIDGRLMQRRREKLFEMIGNDQDPERLAHAMCDPKDKDHQRIRQAMINPATVATPVQPQPGLVIQTPQIGFVGDIVAPPIPTPGGLSGGRYYEWTPGTTHRLYDNRIVKGEEPKEIEMHAREFSYTTHEYALSNRLYERDIANTARPLRMREQAGEALMNAMALSREARVLNVALSAVVPGAAASTGAWSATGGGSPVNDIQTALIAIYNATQNDATHIVIPYPVALEMYNTANWRLFFTWAQIGQVGPLFGVQMALANFGLQVAFSKVCVLTTEQNTASDPDLFANIIGNQVLVFKQDPQPTERSRCFMFAPYRIRDEVVSGRWDREVKTRSEYWQQYEETAELLVDASSGRRITGV